MTDPTRPTEAELEAGHARLLAADTAMTITPFHVPYAMTAEEVEQAQAARATVAKWSWPELRAYYESGMRSKIKEPMWTAAQRPKPPRVLTIEELQRSHDIAAKQREGRTLRDPSEVREPRFMDCTFPPPAPHLHEVMTVAVAAQTAGIEWQGRPLVDVRADLAALNEGKEPK